MAPYATIENWFNEFDKWLKNIPEEKNFSIYSLIEYELILINYLTYFIYIYIYLT